MRSASAQAFATLSSDPALLALLAHVGKSHPTRTSDDEAAKVRMPTQSV
jgi:lysozyme